MNIFVNETPIDFKLEGEETAGMVYRELASWIAGAGQRIVSLELNGDRIDPESTAWHDTAVDGIGEIHLVVESVRQERVDAFETIATYLELLARVARDGTDEQLASVLEERSYVEQGIARVADDLAGVLGEPEVPLAADERTALAERSATIAGLVRQRQQELLDPVGVTVGALPVVRALVASFSDIPVLLQRDGRAAAMDTLARFSVAAATLMRTLPILLEINTGLRDEDVEGVPLAEALPELNEHLREVHAAMERNDLVMLGDLLEYELQPRLTAILDALDRRLT